MKINIGIEKITIPAPLIVVVEDVGWWQGFDGSALNQPYRTGMSRHHSPEDYIALALLGERLGTSVIAGFVWCEWDKDNLLRNVPSATWMGKSWDNPVKNADLFKKTVDIINDRLEYIELAFHGLGHEFWENGESLRTEFHDFNSNMRNREEIIKHFKAFAEIYEKTGIKAPWPRIFIPPALKHSFGNKESGFQKILDDFGFRVVITVFDKAKQYYPPLYRNFTKECDVTLIERGLSPVKWNIVAAEPTFSFSWPVLSLHWSNILHAEPEKNILVVKKWADFLKKGAKENDLIILKDAKEALTQLIYSNLAEIKKSENGLIINLEKAEHVLPNFTYTDIYIKTVLNPTKHIQIKGGRIMSFTEQKNGEILIKIRPDQNLFVKFF